MIPGLNVDVTHEIFRHFVAVDWDGPFALLLVCMQWQDWVISNPILWTWIMVDEQQVDWEQRTAVALFLSGRLPLQVVLRVPTLDKIRDKCSEMIRRCTALYVDPPEAYSPRSPSERYDSVSYKEYTQRRMLFNSLYETADGFLRLVPPGQIKTLGSKNGICFAHATWTIYEQMLVAVPMTRVIKQISPLLVTTLSLRSSHSNDEVKGSHFRIRLREIWYNLPLLPHLQLLDISDDMVAMEVTEELPCISLPRLRELTIDITHYPHQGPSSVDYDLNPVEPKKYYDQLLRNFGQVEGPYHRRADLFDILTALDSSSVESISLKGPAKRIIEASVQFHHSMRPYRFTMIFSKLDFAHPRSLWDRRFILWRADRLTAIFPATWEQTHAAHMTETLKALMIALPMKCTLRLRDFGDIDRIRRWYHMGDIEVVYEESIYSPASELPVYTSTRRTPNHIKTLILATEYGNLYPSHIDLLHDSEAITIRTSHYMEGLMTGRASSPFVARDLDLGSCSPFFHRSGGRYSWTPGLPNPQRDRLANLKTVRCLPEVAHLLVKYFDVPQLLSLTLTQQKDDILYSTRDPLPQTKGGFTYTIEELGPLFAELTARQRQLQQLSTIKFEAIPAWDPLLRFLKSFNKPSAGISTVCLPVLPHLSILQLVVGAIASRELPDSDLTADGRSDGNYEELYGKFREEGIEGEEYGCRPCAASGWPCSSRDSCERYSVKKMVSITQYSL